MNSKLYESETNQKCNSFFLQYLAIFGAVLTNKNHCPWR